MARRALATAALLLALRLHPAAALPTVKALGAPHAAWRAERQAAGLLEASERARRQGRRGGRYGQPEQLEAWVDSGHAVESDLSAEALEALGSAITAEAFRAQLHSLVDGQRSRFVGDSGNNHASLWLQRAFEDLHLEVEVQPLEADPQVDQYLAPSAQRPGGNVLGFLRGTDLANETVILCSHYDSVNWEDTTASAPGVDDNGSGTALVLMVARALQGAPTAPRRSILFATFNAEEEGLVGSGQFVRSLATDGASRFGTIRGVFVADEVAWPGRGASARQAIFETAGRSSATSALVDTLARSTSVPTSPAGGLDGLAGFEVNYHGFGSDHMSFLDAGIPAVLLIERDNAYHADMWGHSDRDTFEHVDTTYGAAMTRLALRAVARLASPRS